MYYFHEYCNHLILLIKAYHTQALANFLSTEAGYALAHARLAIEIHTCTGYPGMADP